MITPVHLLSSILILKHLQTHVTAGRQHISADLSTAVLLPWEISRAPSDLGATTILRRLAHYLL